MTLLLLAVGVLAVTGLGALFCRDGARAGAVAAWGAVVSGVLATVPAGRALLGASIPRLELPWSVPLGSFVLAVDALSAVFLLVIALLGALAAVYGVPYLAHAAPGRRLGVSWCLYNLLLASLVLVVTARDGVLFLMAWEGMSLASYFLVTFEDHKAEVREAGWTYLLATHLGTAFLLAMFLLIAQGGPLDLEQVATLPPRVASAAFLLAVVGFGTKAGFWPLHVWLPQAHPAAPSHVSALMSAVMIKAGVYGLLRLLSLLGPPAPWWGWVLVGIGLVSALAGVLLALGQSGLKRVLAYSSVENIGLVALGSGLGVIGLASGLPVMAALGFAGAVLHVVNHAVFKGLLFLGAGAVLHASGTGALEHLGGLAKRMPVVARTFAVGAAGMVGLPPFGGFVSELLIVLAALAGVSERVGGVATPAAAALAGVGLVAGLAAACFARVYGTVFLGEPRRALQAPVSDPPPGMRAPLAILAALGLVLGLVGFATVPLLAVPVANITHLPVDDLLAVLGWDLGRILGTVASLGALFLLLVVALLRLRQGLLNDRVVGASPTWDCGYAAPTPRMQYTASSFSQPLVELFDGVLRTRCSFEPPRGAFPRSAQLSTATPEVAETGFFRPLFTAIARLAERLHVLQHGRVQLYVLYIALALLALLVWQLGGGR